MIVVTCFPPSPVFALPFALVRTVRQHLWAHRKWLNRQTYATLLSLCPSLQGLHVYTESHVSLSLFFTFFPFWIIQVTSQPVINRKYIPFRKHLQSMGWRGGRQTCSHVREWKQTRKGKSEHERADNLLHNYTAGERQSVCVCPAETAWHSASAASGRRRFVGSLSDSKVKRPSSGANSRSGGEAFSLLMDIKISLACSKEAKRKKM
jgi:hypothetical protein